MFQDRADAGRQLASALVAECGDASINNPLVLALPRGGVPVGAAVAEALGAPLDVLIVRKLGVPRQPEYAFGALGEGGVRVVHDDVVAAVGMSAADVDRVVDAEAAEIERRMALYRAGRPPVAVAGRTVVIVDDGLATGSTMTAAVKVLRRLGAGQVIVAVPVGARDSAAAVASIADRFVCLAEPAGFRAVGQYYDDFRQLTDQEVTDALAAGEALRRSGVERGGVDEEVLVAATGADLPGRLTVPASATGIVVFAHGSGSSRRSPRNTYVADVLNEAGLGTLLFDLLTSREAEDRANVFDIGLLAGRVSGAVRWLATQPAGRGRRIGVFGASTGAAAALVAAADLPKLVSSAVSRGGRPDLAGNRLASVASPTLLIVGDRDHQVIKLNRAAQRQLRCDNRLVLVPGATHLFDEPGTLEQAAILARDHFAATL